MNTGIGIHSRGWTSSYTSPDPPAFLGCMLQGGPEAMVQQRRYTTGILEILFSKQNPLIEMFCRKLRFRQSLAYLAILIWGLWSIPELLYCLLPAYCLLHNSALFPKGVYLGITLTVVGMYSLYTLWEFMSLGFSVHSWYASQSFWRMKTTCSWLFSIPDIILKLLGISKTVFIVTKKTMPETKSGTGSRPSQREDDRPNSYSPKFEFDGSLYFLPGAFIVLVNVASLAGYWMGLQRLSNYEGGGSGLAEACGCILVVILFLPFLKGLFEKGKYGIPLSTLSKAVFLAVLFVAFSVGSSIAIHYSDMSLLCTYSKFIMTLSQFIMLLMQLVFLIIIFFCMANVFPT